MLQSNEDALDSRHGWRVVGGAHAITAITFGSAYAFSALFPGLSAEFNASRGEIALVFSIAAFLFYALGAIAGPLADRWSTRRLVAAGLIAMAAGYVVASQATSLLGLYIAYGVGVGLGIGLSYVPVIGAVQSWFQTKRAKASGIATAGLGLGTLLLPFAVAKLIPVIGWRGSFLMLAAVIAVIGPPAMMLVRRRLANSGANALPPALLSPLTAWSKPGFPLFYLVIVLGSFCIFIPYVHIVPAAHDLGLSLDSGTALIALIGVGNVFGRFVLAGFGDRIGSVRLLALLTAVVAGSFILWAFAANFVMLAIFAVIFGAAYGGCVGLYPAVAAELFGTPNIGALLGYLYTGVGIAALLGPTLAGFVFDRTGTYLGPITASAIAAAIAAIFTLKLQRAEGK
ncbi:MFS transporter [Rhizobium sp. BR 315]|uniref:MFS transporter n=1 Tax=Rhizobium sp. BR 315 TaxID=3040014 RepID=UPI003D3476E0